MRFLDAFARGDVGGTPATPGPGSRSVCGYVWHCGKPCDCRKAVIMEHHGTAFRVLWVGSDWANADEEPWLDLPGALSPQEELHVALWLVVGFLAWAFGCPIAPDSVEVAH